MNWKNCVNRRNGWGTATSAVLAAVVGLASAGQTEEALKLVRTIPLEGVKGRLDHMAIDPNAQRLFLAAL